MDAPLREYLRWSALKQLWPEVIRNDYGNVYLAKEDRKATRRENPPLFRFRCWAGDVEWEYEERTHPENFHTTVILDPPNSN